MNKKYLIGICVIFIVLLFIIINVIIFNDKDVKNYLKDYIDNIECDNNSYIKDNIGYVHCIGESGVIFKYEVVGDEIRKETLDFDYSNTPNISQIHINIDGVDDKYIYLKSYVKNDDSIKDGEYVKCSFKTKVCEYYTDTVISSIDLVKIKDQDTNTFRKYYKKDNRELYLANNIEEVYLNVNGDKVKLIDYLKKSYKSFEDSINSLTDIMISYASLYDGGTTIYNYEDYDITLIKCNKTGKSKDIYIGDYNLKFDESMCNR